MFHNASKWLEICTVSVCRIIDNFEFFSHVFLCLPALLVQSETHGVFPHCPAVQCFPADCIFFLFFFFNLGFVMFLL